MEEFDDAVESLVLADELEGSGCADSFDGVEVVAAEENAEVDELRKSVNAGRNQVNLGAYLLPLHFQALQHFVQMYLLNRLLALLAKGEVSQ